jgi:hypothetical protein
MPDNVLPFPKPQPQERKIRTPSAAELTRKVRRMQKFNCMLMHPRLKSILTTISIVQVVAIIKQGEPLGTPIMNTHGDWQITLKRLVAGRRTYVTVALKADYFVVINVY